MSKGLIDLKVMLWGTHIGTLKWLPEEARSVFQFMPAYYDQQYDIAPIKHKKSGARISAFYGNKADKYQGLPEFIADSLPDKWGNTLFDEWLRANNIPANQANPLLKLSFIGKRGIGALEFIPEKDLADDSNPVDIDSLYKLALRILMERETARLSREEEKTMEKLVLLGSSVGGQHAKGLIAINEKTGETRSGQIELPACYKYFIIKFNEDRSVPTAEIEKIFYDMAVASGITMTPSRLLSIDGVNHFITERFDRINGEKLFTQTLAGLSSTADDYLKIFFIMNSLHLPHSDFADMFRRMVFNCLAGVTDDHNKNFSFIMDKSGKWSLAPAYDVMFTANTWQEPSAGVHSMGVNGKRSFITMQDIMELGEDFVDNPKAEFIKVCLEVSRFPELCRQYGIEGYWTEHIEKVIRNLFPEEYAHFFDFQTCQLGLSEKQRDMLSRRGVVSGPVTDGAEGYLIASAGGKTVIQINTKDVLAKIPAAVEIEGFTHTLSRKERNELSKGHDIFVRSGEQLLPVVYNPFEQKVVSVS